ncbi:XRE family transcriptional regulator (plasmid) [Deinococcus metallilatus]|uniref:Helix-turn-helix transcriptional regulator n=2 Tax=Deinococcus metallilatus TaxID=1211322 RepID=A0AAJ5F7C5_9DEIO|nr:XRE family transcriptional regulator [Deinococcus metallilatus]RXJ17833.1 XRE family transcriptional regulator [Deinococcus metallilatus]TLK32105.1 helix-turn-helix transcriptional regulator [Deinococcus metallilatus]
MTGMNEDVRAFVKQVMLEQDMSQGELARRTGLARPAVTRLLNGTVGKIPENWQRILDELGIEIIAVKKSDR